MLVLGMHEYTPGGLIEVGHEMESNVKSMAIPLRVRFKI